MIADAGQPAQQGQPYGVQQGQQLKIQNPAAAGPPQSAQLKIQNQIAGQYLPGSDPGRLGDQGAGRRQGGSDTAAQEAGAYKESSWQEKPARAVADYEKTDGQGTSGQKDWVEKKPQPAGREGETLKAQPQLLLRDGFAAEEKQPFPSQAGARDAGQRQKAITGGPQGQAGRAGDAGQVALSAAPPRGRRRQGTRDPHLGMRFEELRRIFDVLDVNRDGSITYAEFIGGLMKNRAIATKLGDLSLLNVRWSLARPCDCATRRRAVICQHDGGQGQRQDLRAGVRPDGRRRQQDDRVRGGSSAPSTDSHPPSIAEK